MTSNIATPELSRRLALWRVSRLRILVGTAGSLRGQLVRGSAGSVGVWASSTLLGLALSIILARSLGPEGYGIYAYVFACVSLLAVPAQLGLPTLVVRETSKAEATGQWGLMRGLWRWASLCAAGSSILLALVAAVCAWIFAGHFSNAKLATLAWGLVLVPLVALGNLRGAALRGLRKVVQGQLPENVLRPAIFILLALSVLVSTSRRFTPDRAMALHVLAATISFAIGAWLLRRERPAAFALSPKPVFESRRWLGSALPLAFIAGMQLINTQTDILMLGMFSTAKNVGIYRVAVSSAQLVSFGLAAIGTVTMPHFARLYATGDMLRFQRVATASARASLLLAFPAVTFFLLFGQTILRLVFGADYSAGFVPLSILAGAQLISAGFGMIGPLLIMAGYERETAKGIAVAAGCNVIFSLLLIPRYGINGAAIATGMTLLIWNVTLWRAVRRLIGIDTSALNRTAGLYQSE